MDGASSIVAWHRCRELYYGKGDLNAGLRLDGPPSRFALRRTTFAWLANRSSGLRRA